MSTSEMMNRIGSANLSKGDRLVVEAYARSGEHAAELLCRVGANFRAALTFMSTALAERAQQRVTG